jgi:hypothetical protein
LGLLERFIVVLAQVFAGLPLWLKELRTPPVATLFRCKT